MPSTNPKTNPSPRASRSGWLAALLLALLACSACPAAQAQIVRERPGKIKAANRRALREARDTDSPYKDSHLDVTSEQLKRGRSVQDLPEGSEALRYKHGTAPNVKPVGLLGLRRNKESELVRKEQRHKPSSGASKKKE